MVAYNTPGDSLIIFLQKKVLRQLRKKDIINIDRDVYCKLQKFWAGRKTQVQPTRRGDSPPFFLRSFNERT